MSELPEPPSRHRPMEPELERIILTCLEKDPAKRPESAKELGRLLDLALRDGSRADHAAAHRALTAQRRARSDHDDETVGGRGRRSRPGRQRKRAGLVIGATALVVVAGGVLLSRSSSEPPTPTQAAAPVAAPAPVATAPRPPTTGRLQLRVEGGPADRVSLDGKEFAHATSAVDFGEVAPGAHLVTIEAAGRDTQNTPVTVAAGAPTVLSIVAQDRRAAAQPRRPAPGSGARAGPRARGDRRGSARPARSIRTRQTNPRRGARTHGREPVP